MSRASIFGWSYPPGCSGPPEYEEQPCQMCGEYEDKCKCPECPVVTPVPGDPQRVCGTVGCLEHMLLTELLASEQKFYSLHQRRSDELKRRSLAQAVECEKCGAKIPKDFIDGMEYCGKCEALVGQPKDEVWPG